MTARSRLVLGALAVLLSARCGGSAPLDLNAPTELSVGDSWSESARRTRTLRRTVRGADGRVVWESVYRQRIELSTVTRVEAFDESGRVTSEVVSEPMLREDRGRGWANVPLPWRMVRTPAGIRSATSEPIDPSALAILESLAWTNLEWIPDEPPDLHAPGTSWPVDRSAVAARLSWPPFVVDAENVQGTESLDLTTILGIESVRHRTTIDAQASMTLEHERQFSGTGTISATSEHLWIPDSSVPRVGFHSVIHHRFDTLVPDDSGAGSASYSGISELTVEREPRS